MGISNFQARSSLGIDVHWRVKKEYAAEQPYSPMRTLSAGACTVTLRIARWLVPGEHRDAPFSKGVSDDTETGIKEGIENRLWSSVQLRAYRTTRSRRPISQANTAGRLSGRVAVRRSTELD